MIRTHIEHERVTVLYFDALTIVPPLYLTHGAVHCSDFPSNTVEPFRTYQTGNVTARQKKMRTTLG